MSVVPAASFLVDFGSNEPVAAIADEPPRGAVTAAEDDEGAKEQIEAAYARGLEEGKTAAEAEAEVRLEEQKVALEQSLAASRESWCREEGAQIAEQVKSAIGDLEERIAHATEHVLRPFMMQAVREKAVAELRTTLQQLVAMSPGITLEISGPEDLLEAVRAGLSESVATMSCVANDACDVQVKAGASVVETRIAAWLQQIEGPSA